MPPDSTAGTAAAQGDAAEAGGTDGQMAAEGGNVAEAAVETTSGLLSNDLLDELGGPGGGAVATPPPNPGFGTPSEPLSPSPQQPQAQNVGASPGSLMSIDPWDWKTDAPEFVPGGLNFTTP